MAELSRRNNQLRIGTVAREFRTRNAFAPSLTLRWGEGGSNSPASDLRVTVAKGNLINRLKAKKP